MMKFFAGSAARLRKNLAMVSPPTIAFARAICCAYAEYTGEAFPVRPTACAAAGLSGAIVIPQMSNPFTGRQHFMEVTLRVRCDIDNSRTQGNFEPDRKLSAPNKGCKYQAAWPGSFSPAAGSVSDTSPEISGQALPGQVACSPIRPGSPATIAAQVIIRA